MLVLSLRRPPHRQQPQKKRRQLKTATETASKETIVLRLAETQTETYPATMGAIEFARLVEERTDGRIKIEVFTGGQLGGDEQASSGAGTIWSN